MEKRIQLLEEVKAAGVRLLQSITRFNQRKDEVKQYFVAAADVLDLEPEFGCISNPEVVLMYVITRANEELAKAREINELIKLKENVYMNEVQKILFDEYLKVNNEFGCKYIMYQAIYMYNTVYSGMDTEEDVFKQPEVDTRKVEDVLDMFLNRAGEPKQDNIKIEDINRYLLQEGFNKEEIIKGYCDFLRVSENSIIIENIAKKLNK